MPQIYIISIGASCVVFLTLIVWLQSRQKEQLQELKHYYHTLSEQFVNLAQQLESKANDQSQTLHGMQTQLLESLHKYQINTLQTLQTQTQQSLKEHALSLDKQMERLNQTTETRLKEIGGLVDKRLNEGFEKTTATFTDVIKRLALIDEAQKKITELSSSMIGLHEILADRKSRGAFGEVQLMALIRNIIPEGHFAEQYTFSNGKRADCVLFLPEPSGNIAIDSKFPLETYRKLTSKKLTEQERKQLEQQFQLDIRKHIQDIADKYILPPETSDGAVMFIPAEAIFAEIHGNYPELVEFALRSRVWLVSPTTMMAILTTSRAVLKDAATCKQVHIIQEHLNLLAKDFQRFEKRMTALSKHIEAAHQDVSDVHTSARKITRRFEKIEQVDLPNEDSPAVSAATNTDEALAEVES